MEVNERIKNRRKELGLSADDVAKELGVSRATIYRYESADIEKFPASALMPISKVLKTTPYFLMGWEEDIKIPVTSSLEQLREFLKDLTDKDITIEQAQKFLEAFKSML